MKSNFLDFGARVPSNKVITESKFYEAAILNSTVNLWFLTEEECPQGKQAAYSHVTS